MLKWCAKTCSQAAGSLFVVPQQELAEVLIVSSCHSWLLSRAWLIFQVMKESRNTLPLYANACKSDKYHTPLLGVNVRLVQT